MRRTFVMISVALALAFSGLGQRREICENYFQNIGFTSALGFLGALGVLGGE